MSDLAETFENMGEVDARGVWPIDRARAFLASLKEPPAEFKFARGDDLWCSLLSLQDAAEFHAEARRLQLVNHPRGHYNLALHERYGDAILPWLAEHLDGETLHNVPWNVMPLLLAIGTEAAFDVVYRSRELHGPTYDWSTPDKFLAAWVTKFPAVGFAGLARRAHAGDSYALAALKKLAKGRSRAALDGMEAALGPAGRDLLAKQLKIEAKLEEGEVLALLDDAASKGEMYAWPRFSYDFEDRSEYTALRLVAARDGKTDAWGIALERITGCNLHEIAVERFVYGSEVMPGYDTAGPHVTPAVELDLDETSDSAVGATVRGAAGSITLTKELIKSLDLRPGRGAEPEGGVGGPAVVLLRAYMAKHPGAIWPPVEEAIRALHLDPSRSVVVACTDAFAHADEAPSSSKAFKSAAKAIVARDPSKFDAGKPNTDWRKHAKFKADD
jgi:hypothetical protein